MSAYTFILGYNSGYLCETIVKLLKYEAPFEEVETELEKYYMIWEAVRDIGLIRREDFEFTVKHNWQPFVDELKKRYEEREDVTCMAIRVPSICMDVAYYEVRLPSEKWKDARDFVYGCSVGYSMRFIIDLLTEYTEYIDAGADPHTFEYVRTGIGLGAHLQGILDALETKKSLILNLMGVDNYRYALNLIAEIATAADRLDFKTALEHAYRLHGLFESTKYKFIKPLI